MARWDQNNLHQHFAKRQKKDAQCLKDAYGIRPGDQDGLEKYEAKSLSVLSSPFGEYEAEDWSPTALEYRERRAYYFDRQLVVTVTDIRRASVITSFHHHVVDGRHTVEPDEGRRILKFRDKLKMQERSGKIRKVIRKRGLKH